MKTKQEYQIALNMIKIGLEYYDYDRNEETFNEYWQEVNLIQELIDNIKENE